MSNKSFFESKNPLLTNKKFIQSAAEATQAGSAVLTETSTITGAVNKTLILFSILMAMDYYGIIGIHRYMGISREYLNVTSMT